MNLEESVTGENGYSVGLKWTWVVQRVRCSRSKKGSTHVPTSCCRQLLCKMIASYTSLPGGLGGCPEHTQPTHGISHKEQGVNAPGMAFNHFGQELVDNYSTFLLECSSVSFRVCSRNQPIGIICSLTHNSWAFLPPGSYFLTPSQCFPVSLPK